VITWLDERGEGAFVAAAERIQEPELTTEGAVVKGDPS
jgi:hypothetical protein